MFQRCMHRQWIGTMWNGINHTVKRLYSLIFNINLSAINPPSLDVNRALKRSAWYSRGSAGREASLAVDGNYNPSTTFCIDTGNMDYPWWAVEMDSLLEVDRVVVIASGGCYSIWCIICLLLFCHHFPMDSCKLFNSAPRGQNGRRFPDDIFRRIFVNENVCVLIKILHTFVPKGQINTNAAFFSDNSLAPNRRQAIIWSHCRPEALAQICGTRGKWANPITQECLTGSRAIDCLRRN